MDVRLIELYEESQRGGDVVTRRPRRRDTRYNVRYCSLLDDEIDEKETSTNVTTLHQQDQVLANLVVEEEPGGDERAGEDSQDETGSTSAVIAAPRRLNSVTTAVAAATADDDTLPSSLDGHESPSPPKLLSAAAAASSFGVDSDSSNSSVDIPLLPRREPAGTKRKAEVLSKESGKIGVTITTSPSSGGGSPPPPANKIPRLLPIKSNSTPYHVSVILLFIPAIFYSTLIFINDFLESQIKRQKTLVFECKINTRRASTSSTNYSSTSCTG